MKTKRMAISACVSVFVGMLLMRVMNAAAHNYMDAGLPPPVHLRSFFSWMGPIAIWPNYLMYRLGFVDWKRHESSHLFLAVHIIGWAILGAGIYWAVSFIRSRRKPKADAQKQIALVEWDV